MGDCLIPIHNQSDFDYVYEITKSYIKRSPECYPQFIRFRFNKVDKVKLYNEFNRRRMAF